MKNTFLCSRTGFREAEEQKRFEFTFHVLEQMGLPEDDLSQCFPEDRLAKSITPQHKINLKTLLKKYNIYVEDSRDGDVRIYANRELIAEWKKCRFVLRSDPEEQDPAEKLYYEMHAEFWIFEKE